MKRLVDVFFHWLPVGGAIIVVSGFVCLAVQQNYRQSLNDPQVQMAEDAQMALMSGKTPAEVVSRAEVFDAEKSLSPFIAVYDSNGTPLESSASLGVEPPKPPSGVFDYAKTVGENRVTWQPNPNTRIAIVVRPVNTNPPRFVMAGRNMREVEARELQLTRIFEICLFTALFGSFILDLVGDIWRRQYSK